MKNLSDLSSLKNFEISYKAINRGGTYSYDNPPSKKTFTFKSNGSGGLESKDDIVNVSITYNGKKQKIALKYVK
jgi:hypothetical protein